MIEILKAILFGIVEGITEWLSNQQHRTYDPSKMRLYRWMYRMNFTVCLKL